MRFPSIAVTLAALLGGAPTQAAPPAPPGLEDAVRAIYAPFGKADGEESAPPDIWAPDVAALIRRWTEVMPKDELDGLNDFDWLCECQDWDAAAFRLTLGKPRKRAEGRFAVPVQLAIGWGDKRAATVTMQRVGDRWLVAEIVSKSFPRGLKVALAETIAEDIRLNQQTAP